MTLSTIVTIIVIAFLVAAAIYGYCRGFLRILITTLALVVTLVVSFLITPAFASLLEKTAIGKALAKTPLPQVGLRVVAFLILAILIYIVIRIILSVAHVITKIPVIGGINRFFGGIVGIIEGLLVIWILCMIIQAISFTPFGTQALEVINQSAVLKFFYENNLLSMIALKEVQKLKS